MVTASWSSRGGAVLVMFGKAFVELDWPSNTSYLQEEGAELHKGFRVRSSIEPLYQNLYSFYSLTFFKAYAPSRILSVHPSQQINCKAWSPSGAAVLDAGPLNNPAFFKGAGGQDCPGRMRNHSGNIQHMYT